MAINSVARRASLVVRFRASELANDEGPTTNDALQFFYRHLLICIDAHLTGNLHCFFSDRAGWELRVLGKGLGRCRSIRTAAADCRNSAVGLNHIALTAQQKCLLFV